MSDIATLKQSSKIPCKCSCYVLILKQALLWELLTMRLAAENAVTFCLRPGFVECDEDGVRIGGTPVLKRRVSDASKPIWEALGASDIDPALTRLFGVPAESRDKINGFRVAADALNSGNVAKAQVAVLLMRLPEPLGPEATQDRQTETQKCLLENGWLRKDWDPDKHPRVGSAPDPGRFAPADAGDSSTFDTHRQPPNPIGRDRQDFAFSGVLIDK